MDNSDFISKGDDNFMSKYHNFHNNRSSLLSIMIVIEKKNNEKKFKWHVVYINNKKIIVRNINPTNHIKLMNKDWVINGDMMWSGDIAIVNDIISNRQSLSIWQMLSHVLMEK